MKINLELSKEELSCLWDASVDLKNKMDKKSHDELKSPLSDTNFVAYYKNRVAMWHRISNALLGELKK